MALQFSKTWDGEVGKGVRVWGMRSREVERIRGEPEGHPDRHNTRKVTGKRNSRLGAYVSYVVLLSGGSLLMSLRRREAQGASNFGRFARIFGHHLRPLTCHSLVLAYNFKYDSAHV